MTPKNNPDSEPLGVENSTDILIVLLYAPGKSGKPNEPVDGITRLQKLMFLLQQGEGPKQLVSDAMAYGYKPYKMGPYAPELQRDLNDLQSAGIVHTQRLDYWLPDDGDAPSGAGSDAESSGREKRVESLRFSLTDEFGMQVGGDLWKTLSAKQQDAMSQFKKFFNALTLRQLLIFTYERFPDFTTESTIKSQLGLA
jgi:hypothetical protein